MRPGDAKEERDMLAAARANSLRTKMEEDAGLRAGVVAMVRPA